MNKEKFMNLAIKLAKKAQKNGDVPVGAVIVKNNKVIASAYNKKEKKNNALYHAEILAINEACKKTKNFRLTDCDIYVTKEPCIMCMGALMSARIDNVYFGSYDKKYGTMEFFKDYNFNHKCGMVGGVLEEKTNELLVDFFKTIREHKLKK